MNGLLLIDKPQGPTSFDVIRVVRRALRTKKVGHTGTLDPDATGLLPVAVGHATRFARFLILDDKTYGFELVLGVRTDTDDATGTTIRSEDAGAVTRESIEALLPKFQGVIEQVPPKYSALHVNGRRAYDLAREGVEFELPARPVRIDQIELLGFEDGVAQMQVSCGSGTYVRSIARDLGELLGVGGHARLIRRTQVGHFRVENAITLSDLEDGSDPAAGLMQMGDMVSGLPRRCVNKDELKAIRFGQLIALQMDPAEYVAIFDDDELVAVATCVERESGWFLQPRRVVPTG